MKKELTKVYRDWDPDRQRQRKTTPKRGAHTPNRGGPARARKNNALAKHTHTGLGTQRPLL